MLTQVDLNKMSVSVFYFKIHLTCLYSVSSPSSYCESQAFQEATEDITW